ncbi:MAG: adenylyl-sulfate kinase [Bacteroidetes bacterium]|nr:adenylyl-sulfate kinase [Bacteroidota bacterium]MBT3423689.1 adenylyl-sulfate kinase [Bacteroidota bacterium]MBT3800302.1 adenylyl-sulfate kinase [Bacteroidota bacterium]MBT3935229.1 adenylyl-sulfate kinase [Bacteroidota bacterium]MBT5991574.1 adenylyl-sulfate kinase [Bacteroidota bacterium]
MENIFPIFSHMVSQGEKEKLLRQRGMVFWLTGLSGSGKSTLAKGLERKLHNRGFLTKLLDGDNIRHGINSNLGFSEEDRQENIRRVAQVAKLFLGTGTVTICSFISPTEKMRQLAKEIIGPENFFEIYVKCSLEVCEERDPKGLYRKVRKGEIKNFTGIHSEYEEPVSPNFILRTDNKTVRRSIRQCYREIISLIRY